MYTSTLLTRDTFRESVFARDKHKCVFCGDVADAAHHIIERRLFSDGGYYIDNGASVCKEHHIACEQTIITVEQVREACGITHKVLPEHLYDDHIYDKWGNVILPDGQRMKGELFSDPSVQKVLRDGHVLNQFKKYYKYPRTYHLPDSPGVTDDDKLMPNYNNFENREVVVITKLDGENSNLYHDFIHARSIDGRNHWSRDWVKNFHSKIMYDIPDGFRICGENMYAKHSIYYDDLESYFYGFSMWNEDVCLNWDETIEYFSLLDIKFPPILYRGTFDLLTLKNIQKSLDFNKTEGYVIRNVNSFKLSAFKNNVGKFVRRNHVQTKNHWMYDRIEQNKLKIDMQYGK